MSWPGTTATRWRAASRPRRCARWAMWRCRFWQAPLPERVHRSAPRPSHRAPPRQAPRQAPGTHPQAWRTRRAARRCASVRWHARRAPRLGWRRRLTLRARAHKPQALHMRPLALHMRPLALHLHPLDFHPHRQARYPRSQTHHPRAQTQRWHRPSAKTSSHPCRRRAWRAGRPCRVWRWPRHRPACRCAWSRRTARRLWRGCCMCGC